MEIALAVMAALLAGAALLLWWLRRRYIGGLRLLALTYVADMFDAELTEVPEPEVLLEGLASAADRLSIRAAHLAVRIRAAKESDDDTPLDDIAAEFIEFFVRVRDRHAYEVAAHVMEPALVYASGLLSDRDISPNLAGALYAWQRDTSQWMLVVHHVYTRELEYT